MSNSHEFTCTCNAQCEAKFNFELVTCWNCKRVWKYAPRLAKVVLTVDVPPGSYTPVPG
jgi:Zn-finger nucleic acid-binding protein